MSDYRRITELVNTGPANLFFDQVIGSGEVWEIGDRKIAGWREDLTVSGALTSGTLRVRDGTQTFGIANGLLYFYDQHPQRHTTITIPGQVLVTLSSGVDALGGVNYTIGSRAMLGDSFVSVVSGTNSIQWSAKSIIGSGAVTVTSGTGTVSVDVTGSTQAATAQRGFTKESEGVSTTTSTTLQEKLSMSANVALVATGTEPEAYRLLWYYEYGYSSSSNEFEGRLQVDNKDDLHYVVDRPIATATGTYSAASGFADMLLTSGTHTFDIDYRSSAAGKTARIRSARLSLVQLTLGPTSSTPPLKGT
jgi:hypothetical protein